MSMIGNYRRITKEELAALQAVPDSVMDFLYPPHGTVPAPDRHFDVDKAWHAIQFLLNGDPWEGEWPFVGVVLGGTALGEEDVGYGPARYLTREEVREVAQALDSVPAFTLLDRFNAQALNDAEVYPHGWSGNPEERRYIRDNYSRMVEFFRMAAKAGNAMLLYLN